MQTQPSRPEPTIQVFDIVDVARILKVHRDTVYGLINSGRLKAKRLGKQRAMRVSQHALEEFLADYNT
jgi:excisionase family DNA binding protein